MKINIISETFGYTIDTYHMFDPYEALQDDATDETEIDGQEYRKQLAIHQVEILNNHTDKIVQHFKHQGDYSPREYNFQTDNSELEITVNYTKLKSYASKNRAEFEAYLKDNFTSYDGFMSFVPNNWNEFFHDIRRSDTGYNLTDKERNIAILAGWYFKRECLSQDDYFNEMYEGLNEIVYNLATNLREDI